MLMLVLPASYRGNDTLPRAKGLGAWACTVGALSFVLARLTGTGRVGITRSMVGVSVRGWRRISEAEQA